MKYPLLFSPIRINSVVSRNRIVAAPTAHDYSARAIGGVGIVICGHVIVKPGRSSFASGDQPYLFDKYQVNEARQRIRQVHQADSLASIEIMHSGLYSRVKEKDYAIGPVDMVREDGVQVKAMDEAMMRHTIECFVRTVKDARDFGFDMAFMHFGHGWLAAQFLSPLFNHRTDEYGGSFENRARFPAEILRCVREAVGPHFPIDMRISSVEWVEGSIDFADTLRFIKQVEPYIDTVQLSAGLDINHEGNVHCVTTNFSGHMVNVKFARQVKQEVTIPVSVVGAFLNPDDAEKALTDGDADLIVFGRAFIADPDWPKKAMSGNEAAIVPCIRCMHCYHIATNRRNVGCSVNPRFCNEDFIPKEAGLAASPKKVVIIGGGPAGMSAAAAAAERGHQVILIEKEAHLGGAIYYVAREHYKEDIRLYLNHLQHRVSSENITLLLETEATPQLIEELHPDTLIIAVGSKPIEPRLQGIEKSHVMTFYDAIVNEATLHGSVAIIGGGTIGAEIALELAELHHKEVHLIERGDTLAQQGNMLYKVALRQKLEKLKNLRVYINTECERIDDHTVVIRDNTGIHLIAADSVIIAVGVKANPVADQFLNITPDTYIIGDCKRPRKIMEAVFEGTMVARNL